MAEVLLLHHALGLTAGCRAFGAELRAAGHRVHLPDLYDGATFTTVDDGVAHARQIGFDVVADRGVSFAEGLPNDLVYAGMSLGAMTAQRLAQTRPGARGLVLLHAAAPATAFGASWPADVPIQIHTMADDDWGDVDVAQELAAEVDGAELILYPGDRHLFTDRSLPDFDEEAAALALRRVLDFLNRVG